MLPCSPQRPAQRPPPDCSESSEGSDAGDLASLVGFVGAVRRSGLCELASAKALLNGKEVQRLGAQGPEIAAGLQLAAAWRLLHPHGSKDDAFRWVQERIALMPPGSVGR